MHRIVRDGSGLCLLLAALVSLTYGVHLLAAPDYVAATLLVIAGLSLLRGGVELLRESVGE